MAKIYSFNEFPLTIGSEETETVNVEKVEFWGISSNYDSNSEV